MFSNATIIGTGQSAYARRPEPGQSTHTFIRDAVVAALQDAAVDARDIDGMAVASFSLAPDTAVDLAWKLGLKLRWLLQDTNGGSSAMNMLGHALRGVETGAASTILVVGGDATGLAGYGKIASNYNIATRDYLAPLGHGGPNGVFALVTARQMKKFKLRKSDYGYLAVAQRDWAAKNPYAVYRTPLSMDEYLAAPMVADPLARYDCVPVVAGAQAIVVAHPEPRTARPRPGTGARPPRELQLRQSVRRRARHRHQHLRARAVADRRRAAGRHRPRLDLRRLSGDGPGAAQRSRLHPRQRPRGFRAARRSARSAFRSTPGAACCPPGQPGGPAGGLNGISEAVLQLQHRAGERQVPNARLAVVTGYGMTMYRYGGTAAAAILERME